MKALIREIATLQTPHALAATLLREEQPNVVLLRGLRPQSEIVFNPKLSSNQAPFTLVTARPFLTFKSAASRCELQAPAPDLNDRHTPPVVQFGNPWHLLDQLMARYELLDDWDLPFPLGGCFGFWGFDLKNFVEPKLSSRSSNDLELPDCCLGFYDSLVAFDHYLDKTWVISTGLAADGSRTTGRAQAQLNFWIDHLSSTPPEIRKPKTQNSKPNIESNLSRKGFVARVRRAQDYIRSGDIYQVNLSQRLSAAPCPRGWKMYEALREVSPAPYSAFLDCRDFQLASSSPELFLRFSGRRVETRPIKGTRPRSADPTRDAQWTFELQTSAKENAELVMITDLLRNDLGRVCEFGSVHVPELVRLERYPQVQHLVSTVEGRLRAPISHCSALASCFPGGSITGAPKFRAMQIIEELEPISRGPYTGTLGYLGFNHESQLSIIIRTALCRGHHAWFHVGAGIVADSSPEAEYDETLTKARGFLDALAVNQPAEYAPT